MLPARGGVILREERPKDPLLVARVGVTDPSQAQDDTSRMKCWEAFRSSADSAALLGQRPNSVDSGTWVRAAQEAQDAFGNAVGGRIGVVEQHCAIRRAGQVPGLNDGLRYSGRD